MNFFTQALCWEYYSKPKNLVVIQFIKCPNFEFKFFLKKWQLSESGGVFFQILTHDNYEQTNSTQLKFFYTSLTLGVLHQTEGLSRHKLHQKPQLCVQNLKKKKTKKISESEIL